MQLQQIENEILNRSQQTELVNFAGAPNWAASTNPTLNQALIDYYANRGYIRAAKAVGELELICFTAATIFSVANQGAYALPPTVTSGSPNPPVHLIQRVFYAPLGQNYTLEMEPGVRLIPWKTYQRWTQAGWLSQLTAGPQPAVCSVTPNRQQLVFFPEPSGNGDSITIQYSPVPTTGTLVPLMAAETDVPLLPDECDELIILDAMKSVWERLREFGAANQAEQEYQARLAEIKADCLKRSKGDKMQITDASDDFNTAGPWPFTLFYGGG